MKKILSIFVFVTLITSVFTIPADAASQLSCAGYTVTFKDNDPALIMSNNLIVTEPQVVAMDTKESCAVVVWNTDKLSTSQVVFAEDSDDNATLDILDKTEKEYWGYSNGSAQNNAAQAYHVMIITGLEKGKTYKLRAVSRPHESALPFASKEFKFVFEDARLNSQYDTQHQAIVDNSNLTQNSSSASANNNTANNGTRYTASNSSYSSYNFDISYSQARMAKQINRYYAPAKSSGKFVDAEVIETKYENLKKEELYEKLTDYTDTPEFTEEIGQESNQKQIVEVIGAANAGKSLSPLWDKVKSFFKSLFGIGAELKPENTESAEAEVKQDEASVNEEKISENTELQDGESKESKLLVSIYSVKKEGGLSNDSGVINNISKSLSGEAAIDGMSSLAKSSVAAANSAKSFFERFAILLLIVPVLFVVFILYIVQKFLVKRYYWLEGKTLNYWMSAFATLAVIFGLFKNIPLALSFLAFFLLTLAWHLFNIAIADMDEFESVESVDKNTVDNS